MRVAGVRATLRRLDRETVSGWYAFLVESKGSRAGSWTVQGGSIACHLASAGGIRDGVQISARDFGREMLDTFLDDLVAEQRGRAESWMYENDDDVRLQVRVWDIGVADWERVSAGGTVPDPDAPESRLYPFQLSRHGSELASEVTLRANVVRDRLFRKWNEHHRQPPTGAS